MPIDPLIGDPTVPVNIKQLSGTSAAIEDQELMELRMSFRGDLITPDDGGYDAARAVKNLHIDRRPGMIVRCSGVGDVIDAVDLAREKELLVAVRSGGHHVAGHGTIDNGLVIDLSGMNGVWVDRESRRVRVQGGATWGDVDRESQAFGLAVPGGVMSTTGVAGLTLGGGIGWLHRKWGLACDSLREVEIVTANGEVVTASANENPDLFWAVRGGGGNFGVAVNFVFEAYPLGPIVQAVPVFYRAADGPELLRKWRDWAADTPDEVTTRALFWTMPAAEGLPPAIHDQDVFIVAALYAGDPAEGAGILEPVRQLGTPLADIGGPMPYRFFQAAFDPLLTGLSSYWKSTYLTELTDGAIDLIAGRAMDRPDPKVLVHVPLMGGATSRVGAKDTAFGDRSAPWMLSVDGNWTDPAKAASVIRWTRDFIEEADALPEAGGAYLNFSADESTATEVVEAQFGDNLERLVELKRKYDPANQFRVNNNIRP
jgi:FAD/FMN-containing dehydrogenase